jgi:hypothetical protein
MPSAIEPRLIEGPGAGLIRNLDPRHVPDQAFSNGRNVRFPTGGARVRSTDGYQRVDVTDPPTPIQALWWYEPPSGDPVTLVRIGLASAWQGLGAERASIVDYPEATTLDDVVTIDQYKESLIWAVGGRGVWTWDGVSDAVLLNTKMNGADPPIPSGSPTGKLVEIHKGHVLIGHHTEPLAPWRVAYSYPGNPFDFVTFGAGDQDFLEDSTGLSALKVLGDHAIVHKPNRLYRMIFVGPPDQYIVEGIPGDDGAISARAPISIGSYQYYMGRTNFYRLASFAEPIGDRIWPEVQDSIDWTRAHLVYAYRRLEHDEVCWKIPTLGAAQPTLSVVYNYRDQTWTLTDHDPGLCFTEIPTAALTGPVPGELRRALTLDTTAAAPPPVRGLFAQVTGDIQAYGGRNAGTVPIHAWVESRHFSDGLVPAKVLAVPIFATGAGTLLVTARAVMELRQPMPPWGPAQPLALDPSQTRPWVDVRQYGRLWQIRMESNEMDTEWEVAAFGAAVIPGGYAR